jgi:hypothetical protein
MSGLKITRFLGTAPKVAEELLPDTAAQVARNCKLYSGNLRPFRQPVPVGSTYTPSTIKTLYALRNPDTSVLEWLSWTTDVDIAIATPSDEDDQRFYYTGDGVPKVSNYELAPDFYELGLPIPPKTSRLDTVATALEEIIVSTYQRDNSNTARLTTAFPHKLKSGASVSVTGFTYISGSYSRSGTTITVSCFDGYDPDNPVEDPLGAREHGLSLGASVSLTFTSGNATSGVYEVKEILSPSQFIVTSPTSGSTTGGMQLSIATFNATNVEVTVVDDSTIEYFSPGPSVSELNAETSRVNLSGLTQARSYVYTWYTPWEEESIGSKPSEDLFIKEGQIVTVSGFPTTAPTGDNFIRGVRLYRTLPSIRGTEYFRLATLWFPTFIEAVYRNQDMAQVRTRKGYPHNLDIDDVFRIDDCTVPAFDIVDGVVTRVIDEYTFEYAQAGAATNWTTVTNGVIRYDVSEDPGTTEARYWGLGGDYSFTDDFDSTKLLDSLETDEYEAPPEDLQGLTQLGNNILAGFVGNELFFSEPNRPHAWPRAYSVVLEHEIVGLAAVAGSLLVTTESYPYVVSVTDPAAGASVTRVDVQYPCLNRKSMVTMPYGIVYATHNGLAVYSPSAGPQIITQENYNSDTWNEDLDPTTLVGAYHDGVYLAAHSGGGIMYDKFDQNLGHFVDLDVTFSAVWYDALTNRLYFTKKLDSTIYEWDVAAQPPQTQKWKSKILITPDMLNLGAARVLADYGPSSKYWAEITDTWNTADYEWGATGELIFRLWADKQLMLMVNLNNGETFRLPTGYRSDTYEVEVESNLRVRSIHLAQTPLGLKAV